MSIFVYFFSQLPTYDFQHLQLQATHMTLIVLPVFSHPALTHQATKTFAQHPKRQAKFPQGITSSLAHPRSHPGR